MGAYNYAKLNGRIVEVCGTQGVFAEKMGMSEVSISKRLNNKVEWRQTEMLKAAKVLGLTENEIPVYFLHSN